MRQRLGLAAALLRDPRLLILDEPTNGLDPAGMRDMRALISRLAGEGITVLLSSHLLAEVEELCDRVAIINQRPRRLRGRARRPARHRRRRLPAAHDRPRARAGDLHAQPSLGDLASTATSSRFSADEQTVVGLSLALVEAGLGIPALVPSRRRSRTCSSQLDREAASAGATGDDAAQEAAHGRSHEPTRA